MAITSSIGLNPGIDGILGMGPADDNVPSFIRSLKEHNKIEKTLVSFNLGVKQGDKTVTPSNVVFGGVDPNQFVGDLYEYPIVTDKWWAIELLRICYGDEIIKTYAKYKPS